MTIQFSKGSSLLSKAICWAFQEPVSHVSILIGKNLVFQSNLMGVSIDWLSNFLSTHTVKFEYHIKTPKDIDALIDQFAGRPYDTYGALYLLFRGVLRKYLGVPLPKRNPFHHKGWMDCVELYSVLGLANPGIDDLSVVTPYQLYLRLKEKYPTN